LAYEIRKVQRGELMIPVICTGNDLHVQSSKLPDIRHDCHRLNEMRIVIEMQFRQPGA
jgi:hypothetical protein